MLAIPAVASAPARVTVGPARYQPFSPVGATGEAATPVVGAVASCFTVADAEAGFPATSLTEHCTAWVPSAAIPTRHVPGPVGVTVAGIGLYLVISDVLTRDIKKPVERIGLAELLDGVVTSAGAGVRKPDPAIFEAGLRIAGCTAADAIHIGDSDEDVEGGRAAGMDVIRIDRDGSAGGAADVSSLAEIVELGAGPLGGVTG